MSPLFSPYLLHFRSVFFHLSLILAASDAASSLVASPAPEKLPSELRSPFPSLPVPCDWNARLGNFLSRASSPEVLCLDEPAALSLLHAYSGDSAHHRMPCTVYKTWTTIPKTASWVSCLTTESNTLFYSLLLAQLHLWLESSRNELGTNDCLIVIGSTLATLNHFWAVDLGYPQRPFAGPDNNNKDAKSYTYHQNGFKNSRYKRWARI